MDSIKLFSTGGTISKRYDEISGELLFDEHHINKMLTQGRCTANIAVTSLMLKDSLDMTDTDRELLFNSAQNTTHTNILITHGTDTMIESAKKLSTIKDKTIVLTGAMIPYAFKNSDALFNIGASITATLSLSHGIYICMNGQLFPWDKVIKNKKEGYFETI